ncbi:MAG TPA: hypothetical protein VJ300_05030 [Thermoplasmata archaeon]|nr:hypothetical protein [Thermoplasmata archaeon]
MGTLIEMLASKNKPASVEPGVVPLPMAPKEHEGACGDACGCADGEQGGCCSP